MLTEVKAYSSWASAPTLLLDQDGRPETDLVQIRNIEGLEPVKASVNTSLFGSVDGAAYTGASVPSRNIVLTIHPNPDWHTWKYEDLRKLIYSYFMSKKPVRLVFYSDEDSPVEIFGIVESVDNSIFSKDQEFNVSVICPDPYFTSLDPKVITGQSIRSGGAPRVVTYNGSVETGIRVKVSFSSGAAPTTIGIQVGDPKVSYFNVAATVGSTLYVDMSSVAMQKYIQNVSIGSGVITNLLSKMQEGSKWPLFEQGDNNFSVITDQGVQDWELSFYERFGGL
ncbi:MAG: phage tail domain-containing protein [Ktedonobacteraceae bacterium]